MRIFVLGATGFLGTRVVERLLSDGHQIVALARKPGELARFGEAVSVVKGDITRPATFRGRMLHCQASINLIGLLRQRASKGQTYARVVVKGTQDWVRESEEAGVKHLILVSANGADPHGTAYQRSKWAAEQSVRNGRLPWTILRPSLVVGRGGFVEAMQRLLALRVAPIWGRQTYSFQPVDLDDVAEAIARSLKRPKAKNKVYHLGGPDQLTYREMMKDIARVSGRRVLFIPTPWFVAYAVGALLGWIPFFPASLENFRLLRKGNIVPEDAWTRDLGIQPKPFSDALAKHGAPRPKDR